jgi:NadR type nicotinamide-nucleotide adenylyltransferase
MRRIVITGAESTGKTTLARALAEDYGAVWTPEYVRRFVDETRRGIRAGDLEAIARGQLQAEDRPLADRPSILFHDTNLLSTLVYMRHYFGREPDWLEPEFLRREYALYLLCLPDIPWEPEPGQRESPQVRKKLHGIFRQALEERALPFTEIGGNRQVRLATAQEAVDRLLRDR